MHRQNKLLLPETPLSDDLITINVASLCIPNADNGVITYGVIINQHGSKIEAYAGTHRLKSNRASNICAEHVAMVSGLNYVIQYELNHYPILMVSSIKVCPILENISEDAAYAPAAHYINELISNHYINVHFTWQPRIDNQAALQLAMKKYQLIIKG